MTTTEISFEPATQESAEAPARDTHQQERVPNRTDTNRFVGGKMGHVYTTARPTRYVGGSLGQVEAW